MDLDALIARTEARLAAEKSPKRKAEISADLAMYTRTRAECDDGDDDEDDADDEKKSKKTKKATAAPAGKKSEEKKSEEKKSDEEDEDEEDEEEEKKSKKSKKASATLSDDAAEILSSQASMASDALARVQKLEEAAIERDRKSRIAQLTAERRITPGEAKKWAKKDATFWAQVEEMRPTALVNIDEDELLVPDGTPAADIPKNVKSIVEQGVAAMGLSGEKADKYREDSYAAHRKTASKSEVH